MTATPLSEDDFKEIILPTTSFLELIKRIVLNRFLYNQIKNDDGSVDATVTAYINQDWGHNVSPDTAVTLTFASALTDEDAFIGTGWTTNTTPIPVVFNATDLSLPVVERSIVFHTSRSSPYFVSGSDSSYTVSLFGTTNDFVIRLTTQGNPATKTSMFSLTNGTNTFSINMSADHTVSLKLDSTVIVDDVACGDGEILLEMSRDGDLSLTTSNNSILTTTDYTADFSDVDAFISGTVGIPLNDYFASDFGIHELTVFRDTPTTVPDPDIIPMVAYLPSSSVVPITGTADGSSSSNVLVPDVGYYIYVTLTGTWTGTVQVERSTDNGVTWLPITTHEGSAAGKFTGNADEDVLLVADSQSRYHLKFDITSGSVSYRLAQ
jgi:hypothetical protein